MLRLELVRPFFDKERDPFLNLDQQTSELVKKRITYVGIHLGIVQHSNELLEESLLSNLAMERGAAPIHEDIKKAQGEKDDAKLLHLEPSQNLFRHDLCAKEIKRSD